MELIYLSITILVSVVVESGHAIQCYQCSSEMIPGLPNQEPNCFDPFNAEGIQTTECNGKCFANSTSATAGGISFQMVNRGCMSDPAGCLPTFCQDVPDPVGTGGSGTFCTYCCDGELCNSVGLEDAVASSDKCWTCEENVTDATPGSCASDDFNGNGATQFPCESMCLTLQKLDAQGMPETVSRVCDFFDGQFCEFPGATCCEGNLCNVGSQVGGGMGTSASTLQPTIASTVQETVASTVRTILASTSRTSESVFQCWRCDSAVTNGIAEETPCYTGIFPAENVITVDCPSGKCIRYTYVGEGEQVFSRSCVTPVIDDLGYCDGSNPQIKDVECCTEHLCNEESSVTTIATTTASATNVVTSGLAAITVLLVSAVLM